MEFSGKDLVEPPDRRTSRRLLVTAAAVSAAGMWFQISMNRILSVAWGHQFAYLAISVSLFGVGLGGAAAAILLRREAGSSAGDRWLPKLTALAAVTIPLCLWIVLGTAPDPVIVIGSRRGFLRLAFAYVPLLMPFFFGSAVTAVIFRLLQRHIFLVYAASMLGGAAALGVALAMMYLQSPVIVAWEAFVPALLGVVALRRVRVVRLLAIISIGLACLPFLKLPLSQFKQLSVVRASGEYRVLHEAFFPGGWITAIESALIRETPGQPGSAAPALPVLSQIGVFCDGDLAAVINRPRPPVQADKDQSLEWSDHLSSALPYALRQPKTVLLLGVDGGTELLRALRHASGRIEAVEQNVPVGCTVRLLDHLAGEIFSAPGVAFGVSDLRAYVERSTGTYDLVEVTLHGVGHTGLAGWEAVDCDYLITVEGLCALLRHLAPRGLLSVTCRLKRPPRDAIRLLATLVKACEQEGLSPAGRYIACIRTWNVATLLASRRPLSRAECRRIRRFSQAESFDVWWLPDISPDEVNRYTVLDRPYYYLLAADLLGRKQVMRESDSPFDLTPVTDDRPYFGVTFRPAALPGLLSRMRWEWLPFSEWGYLILLIAAFQCAVLAGGGVLAVLPLFPRAARVGRSYQRAAALMYFLLTGCGFVAVEVVTLQVFSRMWMRPLHEFALVVGVLMTSASAGALLSRGGGIRAVRIAASAVAGMALLMAIAVRVLPGATWAGWQGILVRTVLLIPLGLAMGVPFPNGLALLVASCGGQAAAWAWAVSGLASLAAGPLVLLLDIHLGHTVTLAVVAALYALMPVLAQRLGPLGSTPRRPCARAGG